MKVEYFYCPYCDYEDFDIFISFSGTYANGDFCYCPKCNEESNQFEYK